MSNTLKLGNGKWATGKDTLLSFSDTNNNYKPLAFSFSRDSSATVINKDGLIETVGAGEPRIDFKGNTKGSLLLEPTRTNLVTYSEDFNQNAWIESNTIVLSNNTISPDGSLNASKIYPLTSGNYRNIRFSALSPSAGLHTFSVFAKAGEIDHLVLVDYDGGGVGIDYDLTNGIATDNSSVPFDSFDMISYGNGWYRCIATATNPYLYYILSDTGSLSVTANGTDGLYLWGGQAEQGSYATSYIPTSGSAVTRVAESTSQTVPDGVIGQTEGTVFLDTKMALQSINNYQLFSINNGGGSDRIRVLTATGNRLRFIYQLDGGILAYSFYNPIDYGSLTSLKIAFTYKSGDIKVYINGVLVDSSTNTFNIAEKLINIDIASSAGGYSQMFFNDVKIYNTALTDQELIALTS